MSAKSWFKFFYVGLMWGTSFLWIKIGLQAFQPLAHTTLRIAVAVAGLFLFSLKSHPWKYFRENWKELTILGMINIAIPFVLLTYSQQSISSSLGSILNSTTPLFTIALAPWLLRDERWSAARLIGVGLGFTGVIVLVSGQSGASGINQVSGVLMMLGAALSYALAVIYARWKANDIPADIQAFGQNLVALLVIAPLTWVVEGPLQLPPFSLAWVSIIWIGIFSVFIGTILYFSLLKDAGPTRTSMAIYLYPLVGVFSGAVFLREPLDWRVFAGGLMILAGVAAVNTNWRFKLPGRSEKSSS